jgi:hypothetical protein
MANLLEALNQTAPTTDTTSQLSTLLRAKSGKAVGGPTTALSTQQEQAAQAQAAQGMQPIQQAAQTQQLGQEQQSEQVEQATQIQKTDLAQSRQANTMQTQLRADQLLQELEQGKGKIDLAKYQSSMEQIGQTLRLGSQKYVDNLQREGTRSRLQDEIQFSEQLAQSIFEDNKTLLEKQLGNKSILAANDREFEIHLANLGIADAWAMLNNDLKAGREQARWAGIGAVGSGTISAYGKYDEYQDKKAYYGKGGAGENVQSYEASKYRK